MRTCFTLVLFICTATSAWAQAPAPLPTFLQDRGDGVATSMFGTYVQKGELLVYPFFEWYADGNFEYKPSELGVIGDDDQRGRYRASKELIFLAYGVTDNLALEFEGAVIGAELRTSSSDRSGVPAIVTESGLGDVEMQARWRFARETATRPEAFAYFETVFPTQRDRQLIGTGGWEYKLGLGVTRGFSWGTGTFRLSGEYSTDAAKFDPGEYAFEFLKRLSPRWRIYAGLEGNQLDEVAFITEAQWHFHRRAFLKVGNGFGLTTNATDFAPEIGVMMSF